MIKIVLGDNLRLIEKTVDDKIMQYTVVPVHLYSKQEPVDSEFTMTYVRPDGYKSSDRGLSYQGYEELSDGEFYHHYTTDIRPYHTNIIPGSAATGRSYMSFTWRRVDVDTGETLDMKSSSIVKLTIYRSQEPTAEEIMEPDVVNELRTRMTDIEALYAALEDVDPDIIDQYFEDAENLIHYGDTEPTYQPVNGIWMDTTNEEVE